MVSSVWMGSISKLYLGGRIKLVIDKFQSISSWGSLINFGLPGLRCETKSLGIKYQLFAVLLLLLLFACLSSSTSEICKCDG